MAGRAVERLAPLAQALDADVVVCDILDEDAIAALAKRAGPVDVLINASGTTLGRSILKTTRADIEAQMAMHLSLIHI